ncbi:MAG: serine hydrolase [Bacteriovorax sp.]|nr:serine hydrolase [Bacteriovorax sp.]
MIKTLTTILLLMTFPLQASNLGQIRWPIPDWEVTPDSAERMSSQQCKDFVQFSTTSKDFFTEGLVVIKDGELQYEYYESKYNAFRPHILWSVSKTITGALLGTAVREGKINLEDHLSELYPIVSMNDNYRKIKVSNLFYLDAGFIWEEFYSGDVKNSSVVNMLYSKGHYDMATFAANAPLIPQGPAYKFTYSTGTPTITMGVLKNVYGKDYDRMPWKNFAEPMGLTSFVFEKDATGTFNGGASTYATPRDMAKIGYMYLNNGKWGEKTILTDDWIKKTLSVSPGYLSSGTVITNIHEQRVYGGSIWLNRIVKDGQGKPYPFSPEDMFLAIGHNGQLIIMLPTQKMVIARTGTDGEYNSKIDEFVSRAISCFADPDYPIGRNIPPTKDKASIKSRLETLKSGIEANILQPSVAKTVCSCYFVVGLDINTCLERSKIPMAKKMANIIVRENDGQQGMYSIEARPTLLGKTLGLKTKNLPRAFYDSTHPEFGCTLQ